ncbi:MAG TPA: phosphatidylglycerol lysyltransferase domain-containing protein [Kofleriaceae bacterium]|nr:phosphatidylglycerol lysyltransferase domain-containing protein [Kofleriaceae bacterium]
MNDVARVADGVTDRERVLGLLKRHGWNSTSFQILEPGFRYWFDGDDACVGYVDTGAAWVAAGAPVAAPQACSDVTARFVAAARAAGRRVCCFATEARFHDAAGWAAMRVGDQPIWVPDDWPAVVKKSRSLKEQLRRATAKGVTVRQLAPAELAPGQPIRGALDGLIARWLASRTIAPMGFLVQVDPFTFPEERRYFVAERDGTVVGFLCVIPIYARPGWFFEDFLRDPNAPNGTVELLVDAGMRAAVSEKIPYVTLGLVPLSGEISPWLRAARRWGKSLYDFDGLRAFKAKLKPRAWDPIFLAYPRAETGFVAMFDTLSAFARGGLLRFGLETLLRGPAIVMRVLAVLLVVWTAMLALPVSAYFFPSATWQYGWVGFDVVLAISLFALSYRWRAHLADIVATAVTCDAALTLGQAIVYDLPRRRGVLDIAIAVVAIAAPTVAAILLWNARVHRAEAS